MDRFSWLEFGDSGVPSRPHSEEGAPEPHAGTFLARAECLYLEGRYEPALLEFSRAVAEQRDLFDAWAGQVRCHLAMDELPRARVWANKALEFFPSAPRVLSVAGLVAAYQGQDEEALRFSDQALELSRGLVPPALWLERGECLLRSGRLDAASDCLDMVRRLSGEDPDCRQRIGLVFLGVGGFEQAWLEFQAALERRPDRAWLWYLSARVAQALQQEDRARFALERALALDPALKEARREHNRLQDSSWSGWLARLLSRQFG
jgi:tetratricopeptide (TPR) repeat protein